VRPILGFPQGFAQTGDLWTTTQEKERKSQVDKLLATHKASPVFYRAWDPAWFVISTAVE